MREKSWKCKWNLQCRVKQNPDERSCDDHEQGEIRSTDNIGNERTTLCMHC